MRACLPHHWIMHADLPRPDDFNPEMSTMIYPVIADQILERTGIRHGLCLDLGSGQAPLATALAWISDLSVVTLDRSPEMVALGMQNIKKKQMECRVVPALGDVRAIPARDATFDLVVSRGSFHSWDALPPVFKEIRRVLKPGGRACIGGGYGSACIRNEILYRKQGQKGNDRPPGFGKLRFRSFQFGEIEAALESAGISNYQLNDDVTGFWIVIEKD